MCVTMISLLLVSSTYLSSISLAVSYYLECRCAYVSDIMFNRLSCALGDCLKTSNVLFHMLYVYVFMHFIAFYFHFICFAVAIRFHWSFGSLVEKKRKRSQSGAKELILANLIKWSLPPARWNSLSPLAATSFNEQDNGVLHCPNGVHHFPNGVRHLHAETELH